MMASEVGHHARAEQRKTDSREVATATQFANNSDIRVLLDKEPASGTVRPDKIQMSPKEAEPPSTSEYKEIPAKSAGGVSKHASTETQVFSKVIDEAPSQRIFISETDE